MTTEAMQRIEDIIEGAKARTAVCTALYDPIAQALDDLRQSPRTAALQHYLLGVQRALMEERAAAAHMIADVAALRDQAK